MEDFIQRIRRTVFNPRYHILSLVLALLFGGSMHFASPDFGVPIIIAFGAVFYFLVLVVLIPALDIIPDRFELFEAKTGAKNKLLKYFLIYFLCLLPFLIIKYPGAVQPDTWEMIRYYYDGIMNNKQSLFYSLIINWFVITGKKVVSADMGLFLFLLVQHIFSSFCFAYATAFLDKIGTRAKLRNAVIILTMLNPYVIGYVGVALKDIPFSSCALLLTVLLAEYHLDPEGTAKSFRKSALLTGSVILLCFLRSNGIYVVILSLLTFVPGIIRKHKNIVFASKLLAGIVLFLIFNTVIMKTSGTVILENNYKEALSIPFQQTARYARDYGDDMTAEEIEIIDKNLNIKTLASRYDPRISDPVKNGYTGTKGDLPEYFGVWWKQFLRHPLSYVAATWDQNRSLMLPDESSTNVSFYRDYCVAYELDICYGGGGTIIDGLFTSPECLKDAKDIVIQSCQALLAAPVISVFWNIACCTILLIVIAFMAIFRKRSDSLIYLSPMLSILLITIAGPVIYGHPRYMFPVLLALPFMLIYEFKRNQSD